MAKSDFLSWDDDLDDFQLDYILGKFTDSELYQEEGDNEFLVSADKPKKSKTENVIQSDKSTNYICPECNKILKTIGGFRGHTSKQLGKHNLKAHDHKYQDKSTIPESNNENQKNNIGTLYNTYSSVFNAAFKNTAVSIIEDPMYSLIGESAIVKIAKQVLDNIDVEKFFYQLFEEIFQSHANICMSYDRELFFAKFHKIRLSDSVNKGSLDLFGNNGFSEIDSKNFIQVFMMELVNQLLLQHTQYYVQQSEKLQSDLSDNDQSILYYISGYIIRACEKKYAKLKSEVKTRKTECTEKLKSKSNIITFVTQYTNWTKKNDRGGLIIPADNFYLLIGELETVVRQNVDISNLGATSLKCDKLIEKAMEAFMVKYYCEKLFEDIDNMVILSATEDIIKLFLTIRGYAVTRVQRNIALKDKADTKKKSSSFREALKEMHVNNTK